MVRTTVFDHIVEEVLKGLQLPNAWQTRVLQYLSKQSDVEDRRKKRAEPKGRLRRLVRCWIDLGEEAMSEAEYEVEKKNLEQEVARLSTIADGEAIEAGEYLQGLSRVWEEATEAERRDIIRMVMEKVLVDTSAKDVIALKPRRPFLPLFATLPV
jgi:ATP phosphoribosyltransferase regulatory subunit HisZ